MLHITADFLVTTETPQDIKDIEELLTALDVPWRLEEEETETGKEIHLKAITPQVDLEQELPIKRFLHAVGEARPGFLVGEVEVWWPFAVTSGPEWWALDADGVLWVIESELVRATPQRFTP